MITDINYVKKLLPKHANDVHKGNRGKVLIVGGSTGLTGAVCMSANAALRSGTGLVTVAVPRSLNTIFEIKLTEVMTFPIEDVNGEISISSAANVLEFGSNCDAVAIGPGAGTGEGIRAIVELFITEYNKKLILDADALNALAKNTCILNNSKCDILLTPHVGEMCRLTKMSVEDILKNREETAQKFANDNGVSVLLKGKGTVITDGENVFVNPTGNSGMAKGGSGDVLTGICVSLASQGLSVFDSGVLGAYIHGLSGDISKEKFSDFSMTPCDIIDNLGCAFQNII